MKNEEKSRAFVSISFESEEFDFRFTYLVNLVNQLVVSPQFVDRLWRKQWSDITHSFPLNKFLIWSFFPRSVRTLQAFAKM